MKRFFAELLRDRTGRIGLAGVLAVVVVALLSQLLAIPVIRPALFGAVSEDDRGLAHLLRSPTIWLLWLSYCGFPRPKFMKWRAFITTSKWSRPRPTAAIRSPRR